jgi:nucleoside-diphosphate-sugar epimerase
MSKQPTIIITGASGLVGTELVDYFSRHGYNVRALVRKPEAFTNTDLVTYFAYDMSRPFDDDIFEKADYLVHAAYIKDGKDIMEANIDSAKALLKASRVHKIKKNIFISSMSADKDALSAYGKQKYAIEQLFHGKNDTVIRSGLIIGDGGLAKQVITFMSTKHVAPLIDNGSQPIQIIAVNDMARVIHTIIDKNISGKLNIGTPRVYTYKEFYQTIKQERNVKALLVPVPFIIPLIAIRLIRALHLPLAVTEDNLQGLKRLRAYETKDDLARLDITLAELDEALR